jgi:HK97 family phage major capsid protein
MPTLTEAREQVRSLASKMLVVVEDPNLTDAEKQAQLDAYEPDLAAAQEQAKSKEQIETKRRELLGWTEQAPDAAGEETEQRAAKSLGRQFVESGGYQQLMRRGLKGGQWSSGDVELTTKATLTEGTSGTPGGGYWPSHLQPTILPGVTDIRFRQPVVEDLLPAGATSSPLIRYLVETAVTNAAATVAEGGLKPESAISFDRVDETLRKIATFLPITDEMLEDWEQTQSYVDGRLTLFIRLASETQLLNGDGTGNNLVGLLNRPGLATSIAKGTAPSAAGDNDMDAIYRQITAIRQTAFLEPDAIVIDPTSWQNILISKNSQGFYYAAGPFAGEQPAMLWGKRVVVTPVMAANTALVGAFSQAAQMFTKGGLTVEASNSHADFFQRNQTAIRAERRLGLAVYRPGAFGTVTALS